MGVHGGGGGGHWMCVNGGVYMGGIGWVYMGGIGCVCIGALDGKHWICVHAWPLYVPVQLHGPLFQSNVSRTRSQHYMHDAVSWDNCQD